jgi:hypothetical protein
MEKILTSILVKEYEYLKHIQNDDGSFSHFSFTAENKKNHTQHVSPFFTAQILFSLKQAPLKQLKQKAADFLMCEKSEYWSFNYWKRNSPESTEEPYPDDIDDTCCSAIALFTYNNALLDGNAVAGIVHLLTAVEEKEGGPYRTWLTKKDLKEWHDIDIAVNCNIAFFLSLLQVELPGLTEYIEKHIADKNFVSKYYYSENVTLYFLSRFYKGKYKENLIQICLDKLNNQNNNLLDVCLLLNALLYFGYKDSLENYIHIFIEKYENKNILLPFIIEKIKKNTITFAGAETLTSALCIETVQNIFTDKKKHQQTDKREEKILSNVKQSINDITKKLSPEFKKFFLEATENIIYKKRNGDIVPLLPYYFTKTLRSSQKVPDEMLVQLGTGNTLGWLAYTIYDDFLDNEGKPEYVSTANTCLRELTHIFLDVLPENNDFKSIFIDVLNGIDESNFWEVTHCRFKKNEKVDLHQIKIPAFNNYQKLADKSLGHALGVFAILSYLGYNPQTEEFKKMKDFFIHYLIAKQLNDDAHDWEEDLLNGMINPANALVLSKFKKTQQFFNPSLKKDLQKAEKIFWGDVLMEVCTDIKSHTQKATKIIKSSEFIKDIKLYESLLFPLEKSADKAIETYKKTKEFLKSY